VADLYRVLCCSALAMSFVSFVFFVGLSTNDAKAANSIDPARRTLYASMVFFVLAVVVLFCGDFFGA